MNKNSKSSSSVVKSSLMATGLAVTLAVTGVIGTNNSALVDAPTNEVIETVTVITTTAPSYNIESNTTTTASNVVTEPVTTTASTTTTVTTTTEPIVATTVTEPVTEVVTEPTTEAFSDLAAIELSSEDMALFTGVVAAETYSWWEYTGHKMIADVIRNRVEHPAFAECTIRDILTADGQFTTYSNGRWQTVEPNESQIQAAYDAAAGVNMTLPPDVVFFCTVEYYEANPGNWFETLKLYGTYDNTMFFYHSSYCDE